MASTIQVRVDDSLKQMSDELFRELGTDTTSAIRMFLVQAIANNGFPFEIKRVPQGLFAPRSEMDFLAKLEKSRDHAEQGLVKDADEVLIEMRGKYDL